jgi:Dullard-like phosphatase family protein
MIGQWTFSTLGSAQALGSAALCRTRIFRRGSKQLCLGRPAHRLTVCLDLDECLIHAELAAASSAGCWSARRPPGQEKVNTQPDFQFGSEAFGEVRVWRRPRLAEFLQECRSLGEVVLYTSSTEEYARAIVSHLDPAGAVFSRVLSRRLCHQIAPGLFAKDLGRLGTPLGRTVLVDDLATCFSLQPDNGIPIAPFFGDAADTALDDVLACLRALAVEEDVRPLLSKRFSVRSTLEQLVSEHAVPPLRERDRAVDRNPM